MLAISICLNPYLSYASTVYISAIPTPLNISLNNQLLDFGFCQPYVNSTDQVMVPLRFMVETLESKVSWEETSQSVIISNNNLVLKLKTNQGFMSINDETIQLNTPMIYNSYYDCNYIPLSFLSVYLGITVESHYDKATQQFNVYLQKGDLTVIPPLVVARGGYEHDANPLDRDNLKLSLTIDMPSSQIEFLMGKPLRKDTHAFMGETWVYKRQGVLTYIYLKNSKVIGVFVTGSEWKTDQLKPGSPIDQVKKFFPIIEAQTVKVGSASCTIKQKIELSQKKYITITDDTATEFLFDTKKNTLIALRIMKVEHLIASGSYGLEWRYRGSCPQIKMPLLSSEQQLAVDQSAQRQIFDITNVIRETYGLNPLTLNASASQVALGHSKDMFQNKYVAHVSPIFGTVMNRYKLAGISYGYLSENIAYGSFDGIEAVYSWLHSDGHRNNLLSPNGKSIGIGVTKNYYTQNFITQK